MASHRFIIRNYENKFVTIATASVELGIPKPNIYRWYNNEGIDSYKGLAYRNTDKGKKEASMYNGSNIIPNLTKFNRNKVCYLRDSSGNITGRCEHYYNLTESFYPDKKLPDKCKEARISCDNFKPIPIYSDIKEGASNTVYHRPTGVIRPFT